MEDPARWRLGGKSLMLWAPKTTASPHGSARNQFNVMRSLPVPWLSSAWPVRGIVCASRNWRRCAAGVGIQGRRCRSRCVLGNHPASCGVCQGLASRASGVQRLSESTASARVKAKRDGRGWASDSKLGQLFHSCLLGTDFPSGAQLTWCERVETPRHARASRIWRGQRVG